MNIALRDDVLIFETRADARYEMSRHDIEGEIVQVGGVFVIVLEEGDVLRVDDLPGGASYRFGERGEDDDDLTY